MIKVYLQFHNSLNDFLPPEKRNIEFSYAFKQQRSIKDLIESVGIPHTEIDLIIINSVSVTFNYQVINGEHIKVYPADAGTGNLTRSSNFIHLQPEPIHPVKFILDVHLGKLARNLRMLGFDSLYQNTYKDAELAEISANENRILLSCDVKLLMRNNVIYGYFVRSRDPRQQLLEIISRFDLSNTLKPFSRCMQCNAEIHALDKQDIESQLLEDTRKYYNDFYQCSACSKIYWKGSHYRNMQQEIERIIADQR